MPDSSNSTNLAQTDRKVHNFYAKPSNRVHASSDDDESKGWSILEFNSNPSFELHHV
jgi:hypothetical protein